MLGGLRARPGGYSPVGEGVPAEGRGLRVQPGLCTSDTAEQQLGLVSCGHFPLHSRAGPRA